MSSWSGFSDAEIERFQKLTKDSNPSVECPPAKSVSANSPVVEQKNKAVRTTRNRNDHKVSNKNTPPPAAVSVNGQQSDAPALSVSSSQESGRGEHPSQAVLPSQASQPSQPSQPSQAADGSEEGKSPPQDTPPLADVAANVPVSPSHSHEDAPPSQETTPSIEETDERLIQLQKRQKLMEEQNKRKKAVIMKAIHERKRRADAESVKARKLQVQLSSLEMTVSTDVELLRAKIEEASRLLCEAQRRYDRAEKEWVVSKEHLFRKKEQKELLSEHLYTILHTHEEHKADRLRQMMTELQLTDNEEDNVPAT